MDLFCSMFVSRGCQTQEKVVAASAKIFVVIADYRCAVLT